MPSHLEICLFLIIINVIFQKAKIRILSTFALKKAFIIPKIAVLIILFIVYISFYLILPLKKNP